MKLLPKLLRCGMSPQKVAATFINYVESNQFDIYIYYGINMKKSERVCMENDYFFKQIQKDRLGIRSFLLEPIQRLPRYQMLLAEMSKDLMQDLDENKDTIAACCRAEKKVQKLLDTVNTYCSSLI